MKKQYPVLLVLLGIAVGALSVLIYDGIGLSKRKFRSENVSWRKLNLILRTVEENYVDTIDYKTVSEAAVVAALAKLDPHSVYMPPVELEESETDLAGEFEGVGLQFNVPNDTAVVLEAIPGGPSAKAGVIAGDRIVKVDDKVIAGVQFPQDSMVRRMRGKAGTKVLLTIRRGSEDIPFEITRSKIAQHCVDAAFMVGDTTAYLRLSKFSRTTFKEVYEAVLDLSDQGMKRLIFDIRGNSGGFLDQALEVCNLFLPKGAGIVYMEGLHRNRDDYRANGRGPFQTLPMAVLIDDSSASSSEIFAGAMQDNGRAVIIGRRSFGKGLVQEPVYFTDGSGIRLTVARFYTPSGRCIQKPYSPDYNYEVFERYGTGEMVSADSMKLEKGGIIPDIFVPVDTTRATPFYIACNRKATSMRFASWWFDTHRNELQSIESYDSLLSYLDNAGLEGAFLSFAQTRDGLKPKPSEMPEFRTYTIPQIRALVGRYSQLGDRAFYHLWLEVDDVFAKAMESETLPTAQ